MANGDWKRIDQIEVGDWVVATDPHTGETSSRVVVATHVNVHDGDLLELAIEDGGSSGIIHTTDEHRFWSSSNQEWVPAIELDEGDLLRQADDTPVVVTSVDQRDGRQHMWDLTVAIDHTFYVATIDHAGRTPTALVHNQDLCQREDVPFRVEVWW